jgi:hypothetical protein
MRCSSWWAYKAGIGEQGIEDGGWESVLWAQAVRCACYKSASETCKAYGGGTVVGRAGEAS